MNVWVCMQITNIGTEDRLSQGQGKRLRQAQTVFDRLIRGANFGQNLLNRRTSAEMRDREGRSDVNHKYLCLFTLHSLSFIVEEKSLKGGRVCPKAFAHILFV